MPHFPVIIRAQVDTVYSYTDFNKVFNKTDHVILVQKLQKLGVSGNLLQWLISYFFNNSQLAVIRGFSFEFYGTPAGVPQDSHLGHLLFNIFSNDIVTCFRHVQLLLYAYDFT